MRCFFYSLLSFVSKVLGSCFHDMGSTASFLDRDYLKTRKKSYFSQKKLFRSERTPTRIARHILRKSVNFLIYLPSPFLKRLYIPSDDE